jgi:hypothetical protein
LKAFPSFLVNSVKINFEAIGLISDVTLKHHIYHVLLVVRIQSGTWLLTGPDSPCCLILRSLIVIDNDWDKMLKYRVSELDTGLGRQAWECFKVFVNTGIRRDKRW